MKCPTCGAENEAGNRFCEQCGSRIEPSGGFPQAQVALAAEPTAAGPTCPSCGAAVLPGEAFCDECGASLTGAAPTVLPGASNDAPTMIAPPPPAAAAIPSGVPTVICPACGQPNLATDRFCDHCGATLDAGPATASAPVAADAPTVMSDQALLQSLNTAPPVVVEPEPDAVTVTSEEPAPAEAPAQPVSTNTSAEAPTVEQPMISAAPDGAQAAYEAEQSRLNEEIERQQKIIAQFEQMQAMFGAAAPAAVTQGLADARDAQARAEAELAALQPPAPPAPPVDPAEVARLNEEIERQQKIIAQFEQMQAMFGAAAPAAVTQGLADARDAQSRAEAELAALTGGSAPTTPTPAAAPTAPSEPQVQVAAAQAALNEIGTVPAAAAIVPPTPAAPVEAALSEPVAPAIPAEPVAQAAPASPRLVIDDGKDVTLPTDKREIIIGREDPISGIFPEVDLTPFGGETGGVSRQHARINHDAGQWTVTDLNSTNYTRVDGNKIEPNVAVPIKDGARLQFGRVAMTFRE